MSFASSTCLTSLSCTFPVKQTSGETFLSTLLQWLTFIFLSPCPQRAMLSFVDVVLLLFLSAFAVTRLWKRLTSHGGSATDLNKPLIKNDRSVFLTTIRFKLTLTAAVVLTILYTVACVFAFRSSSKVAWKEVDEVFWP
ncbi:ABC transporter C family member 4, partial [Mucuna pruriens]